MYFGAEGFPALFSLTIFIFLFFVIPVSLVAYIFSKIHARKIRYKYLNSSVVKAEFDPPHGLSPAEIGYLFDSKTGNKESLATLLDLEQRNIIKITKTSTGRYNIFSTNSGHQKLKPHEELIVSSLSALKDIDITKGALFVGFNKSVRTSLKNSGLIGKKSDFVGQYIFKVFISYLIIGFILFAFIVYTFKTDLIAIFVFSIVFFVITFPAFFALSLVIAYINNVVAGHSGLWSSEAKKLWPEIEGYREYIRQVELDEIQFDSEELKLRSKNRALPYAVAFGFNTNWQKRKF